MKANRLLTAVSLAAALAVTPLAASADDDRWEHERDDRYRKGASMQAYDADEVRIMAHARALRRYGPGIRTTVEETPDGTYIMQVRDKEDRLLREHEFNLFGAPVRGKRHD